MTAHSPSRPLLTLSTLPWRRWTSQIGCSTFLTPNISAASRAHIGAGTTTSDDGRPMTINVETIGDALMVQHFVSEVPRESKSCALVSISDAITPKGRTKVQVVWELSARRSIIDHTCESSNYIHASATDEFLAFIEKNGVTFEQAGLGGASNSHNHEETPNFAKSIERRSLLRG